MKKLFSCFILTLLTIPSINLTAQNALEPLIWAEKQDSISFNLETALGLEKAYGIEKTRVAGRRVKKMFKYVSKSFKTDSVYTRSEAKYFFELMDETIDKEGLWRQDATFITPGLLKDRYGLDCDNLSLIYVDFGKRLGLPIKPVCAENHMFVRWEFSDSTYLNWDPRGRSSHSNDFYRASEISVSRGAYLKSLNNNEALGSLYFIFGFDLVTKKDYANALTYLNRSLELNSALIVAYLNKATALDSLGKYQDAISVYNKIETFDTTDYRVYSRRGKLYERTGEYNNAIKDYLKALKYDTDPFGSVHKTLNIYYSLVKTYRFIGDLEKADFYYEKLADAHPGLSGSYLKDLEKLFGKDVFSKEQ